MTEQLAGETTAPDQGNPTLIRPELFSEGQRRAKDIVRRKRLTLIYFAYIGVAFVAQATGTILVIRLFDWSPLTLGIVALWNCTVFAYIRSGKILSQIQIVRDDLFWQDHVDELLVVTREMIDQREKDRLIFKQTIEKDWDLIKQSADQTDRMAALLDQSNERDQIWVDTYNELSAIVDSLTLSKNELRGRGRPEVTVEEASKWIDKANQAATELLVRNGRRPTRDDIAREIGLSTSTLGRYEKIARRKVSVNK